MLGLCLPSPPILTWKVAFSGVVTLGTMPDQEHCAPDRSSFSTTIVQSPAPAFVDGGGGRTGAAVSTLALPSHAWPRPEGRSSLSPAPSQNNPT